MFGLGFGEILIIFLVALIVLGPKKLPQFAVHLARFLSQLKNTLDSSEVKEIKEVKKEIENLSHLDKNPNDRKQF